MENHQLKSKPDTSKCVCVCVVSFSINAYRATHASPAGPSIYRVVLCALGCHSKMSSSDVRLLPKQFGRARVPTRSIKIWNRPYQPELHTGRVSSCVSETRRKIKLELSSILPNRRNFSPPSSLTGSEVKLYLLSLEETRIGK